MFGFCQSINGSQIHAERNGIMKRYLIDVNLPRYFALWSGDEYEHVVEINDELKDSEIWRYAKEHGLTIVTKY